MEFFFFSYPEASSDLLQDNNVVHLHNIDVVDTVQVLLNAYRVFKHPVDYNVLFFVYYMKTYEYSDAAIVS